MDKQFIQQIEQASRAAWRALEEQEIANWILRFAKGYTKRANSVNILYDSDVNVEPMIDACEKAYTARGLPPIFRITPLAPPELDHALARRDYQLIEPSRVLVLDLENWLTQPTTNAQNLDLDAWIRAFCQLTQSAVEKHQTHREILLANPAPKFLAVIENAGQPVACGLGVLTDNYFGIFDVITDAHQRNQGRGRALMSNLLHWARDHGATRAYLQVTSANAPARYLYAKIGFADAYEYWYRIPAPSGAE